MCSRGKKRCGIEFLQENDVRLDLFTEKKSLICTMVVHHHFGRIFFLNFLQSTALIKKNTSVGNKTQKNRVLEAPGKNTCQELQVTGGFDDYQ